MTSKYLVYFILGLDTIVLFLQTSSLSISASEASLLYGDFSFLQLLVQGSLQIFGNNDFGLRAVMILMHLGSSLLFYLIAKRYVLLERNVLWLLVIFILLPGVVSSAIVVNSAGMIIFGLLLYIYLSEKVSEKSLFVLLLFYSLIDIGFSYLFLGLGVYYIFTKKNWIFIYMLALYSINSILYGFEVYGSPSGHFLDTIGVYSAIFSPIIFIYIFYTLYRCYIIGKLNIIWYISVTALILSLVLSFRQRVAVEHFAPYLLLALPLAADLFISSYRVRLKMYRKKYKLAFVLSFAFLFVNTLAVFFNRELYQIIKNPKEHFTYNMDIAKDLAQILHKKDIKCISSNENMQDRLYFYGIKKCNKYKLTEIDLDTNKTSNVTISYKSRVIYMANVTKINNR